MRFTKKKENAKLPVRGSAMAAGVDLHCLNDMTIYPTERKLIPTGVGAQLFYGEVGLIWPRSKLSNKHGIDVLAGVIDADYTGEIHVILLNTGDRPVDIKAGDAIAQFLIQSVDMSVAQWSDEPDEETERGEAGILDADVRK